ncbi:hypothetical protein [Streptosporangium amethystogenes]|uniref:hypothetical protein n=1 Tax=Streptosporangium amethystogenes TaxID=2002 RepID=UPI0004C92961|nr:hypothetical protein [Streptosporangium amethystogenes]
MSKKHKAEHPGGHGKDTPSERGRSSGVSHASEEVVRSGNLAFGHPPGGKGPERVISDAERKGVPATDTEARSAHGVGTSEHRGAEKIARKGEKGRKKVGTDEKGRPYGVSRPEDITGVNPQKTITRDDP